MSRGIRPLTLFLAAVLVSSSLVLVSAVARDSAARAEPPPGGLVTSVNDFDWTEGEFSVSDDGAAQYDLPMWRPDGRGEVAPDLSLAYDSRAGNGPLGVGWSLEGLPSMSWCARTQAQDGYSEGVTFDGTGALCLGGNRLVPISAAGQPEREYRTEQATFARIVAYGMEDGVPSHLKMWAKDHTILTFGETADSRLQAFRLRATSSTDDPGLEVVPGGKVTVAWGVNKVEDRNGNAATVTYERTEGDAAGLRWTQMLPKRIVYPPNRRIEFEYEDGRSDPVDNFARGVHSRVAKLLIRVEMWGGPQGGAEELLRQYRLNYQSPAFTGRHRLSSVAECDHDAKCKLPLTFGWSQSDYEFDVIDIGPVDTGMYGMASLRVLDINGDGLGDVVYGPEQFAGGPEAQVIRLSTGNGFGPPVALNPTFRMPKARFTDIDADGRTDRIGTLDGNWKLFQSNGSQFVPASGTLGAVTGEWSYAGDLDGNGLPDFTTAPLTAGAQGPWYYRLNTGTTGSNRFGPRIDATTPMLFGARDLLVDTDGDGRVEVIGQNSITDCFGEGWIGWGVDAQGAPEGGSRNLHPCVTIASVGDVNGDGLDDMVMPYADNFGDDRGRLEVQLNSGNGYGSFHAVDSPTGYIGPERVLGRRPGADVGVRVVDFNNDGHDDVLIFRNGPPSSVDDAEHGLQVYVWTDTGFRRERLKLDIGDYWIQPNHIYAERFDWSHTQPLDVDGNGVMDLVRVNVKDKRLVLFKRRAGVPDRLTGIGNTTYGPRIEVEYTNLADRDVHTPGTCNYAQACLTSGGTIVRQHRVTSNFGAGADFIWDTYTHTYSAARTDLHGRGWLGFASHTVTRTATGETVVTELDNVFRDPATRAYPKAHLPRRIIRTVASVNSPTGREMRHTVMNGHAIRALGSGTYAVELHTITEFDQERQVGATAWTTLQTNVTTNTYDDLGNPDVVESVTTNGRKTTVDLDHRNDTSAAWLIGQPTRSLVTGCPAAGPCTTRETWFDYDAKGNHTITVVEPNRPEFKLTTTTAYGQLGNVTSVTEAANTGPVRTETFEYANADKLYPTARVNAAGHRTVVDTHSGLGVPLRIVDPNGFVGATMTYDWFGRLRQVNRADGSFERIDHLSLLIRQITTTTVSGGGSTAVWVDQLGRERERRVKTFDGSTATTYTNYDPFGRGVWQESRPTLTGQTPVYTTTLYDNAGRVVSITEPDGKQARNTYLNREVHTFDAKGVESYTTATVDGDIESSYEDDPNSTAWLRTRFEYGPFGDVTKVVAPDSTAQSVEHDLLGRPNKTVDPSTGTTLLTHNAFGDLTSVTDDENRVSTFEPDALGRVKKETSADGVATWVWDTAANGIGKLARATSTDGVVTAYTYDAISQPITAKWTIDGTAYEMGYGYDEFGRQKTVTYPSIPGLAANDRLSVTYGYNAHGYLATVSDTASGNPYWTALEQNAAGQLVREKLGNNVLTGYGYQAATGLVSSITTTGPGTAGTIGLLSYAYDDNRNVTGRGDWVNGRGDTYTYDQLDRLKTWVGTRTGGTGVNATYTYDKVGNLKTETVTGVPNQNVTYAYGGDGAPPHALTTRNTHAFTYDGVGRLITGLQRTVTYNRAGLPKVLTWGQNGRTDFRYDANGARAVKHDDGQTVHYAGGVFERRFPAGTAGTEIHNIHYITVDDRVVAQVNRAQAASGGPITVVRTWYPHTDAQGSTTMFTDPNGRPIGAEDTLLAEMYYDPFGRRIGADYVPLGHNRNYARLGYAGHEQEDEFGLINMVGRIYDPELRRFLTPDPVNQNALSSQGHNRYAYVLNNPTTLTDPDGFQPSGNWDIDVIITNEQPKEPDRPVERRRPGGPTATPGPADDGPARRGPGGDPSGRDNIARGTPGSSNVLAPGGFVTAASGGVGNSANHPMEGPAHRSTNNEAGSRSAERPLVQAQRGGRRPPSRRGGGSGGRPSRFAENNYEVWTLRSRARSRDFQRGVRLRERARQDAWNALQRRVDRDPPLIVSVVPQGGFPPGQAARVRNITVRLARLARQAASEVDARGDRAFTPGQLAAIKAFPLVPLRPMFRGNRIDVLVRQYARYDRSLRDLVSNYTRGPDFVDPLTGVWWDITTVGQWRAHTNRYGPGGVQLNTR